MAKLLPRKWRDLSTHFLNYDAENRVTSILTEEEFLTEVFLAR